MVHRLEAVAALLDGTFLGWVRDPERRLCTATFRARGKVVTVTLRREAVWSINSEHLADAIRLLMKRNPIEQSYTLEWDGNP